MATPIIDSAVANPASVAPGGAFVVTVVAHDPDSRVDVYTGTVTDGSGNQAQVTVEVPVIDQLTFELTGPGTITPRAGQPGVFDVVAP